MTCSSMAVSAVPMEYFHEIGPVRPADSLLFHLIPKPIIFLLERQVSDLLRAQLNQFLVIYVHYRLLFPLKLCFLGILGNLPVINQLPSRKCNPAA